MRTTESDAEIPSRPQDLRRSKRVVLVVPLEATWVSIEGKRLREKARTEVVSAHGALLRMQSKQFVPITIELHNFQAQEPAWARVLCFRAVESRSVQFAVELAKPSGTLWGLDYSFDQAS